MTLTIQNTNRMLQTMIDYVKVWEVRTDNTRHN